MIHPRIRLVVATGMCLLASSIVARGQDRFPDSTSPAPRSNGAQSPPLPTPPAPAPSRAPARSPAPVAAIDAPASEDPRFAEVARIEAEDFGIAPTDQLRGGPLHAPTPTLIPGGLVITTEALNSLYDKSAGSFIVFDVLNGQQGLPDAQNARPAGAGGTFNDQTQREFGNYLQSVAGGNKNVPLVFYCQNTHCWMSYNAALRAIRMGYTKVLWYRGGIEAWQQAGLPTYPRQF